MFSAVNYVIHKIVDGAAYIARLFTHSVTLGDGSPKVADSKQYSLDNQKSLNERIVEVEEKGAGRHGFPKATESKQDTPANRAALSEKATEVSKEVLGQRIDSIVENLKRIKDPELFKLERSKRVAELLINEAGELNVFLIDSLKRKLPKSISGYYEREFNEILDKLKNDREFAKLLTSINSPKDPRNKANQFIRATLNLAMEAPVTAPDARRAVLSALLMDLRQAKTGSCFTTGIAIRIHSTEPERFLQDMKDLVEKGYMDRSLNEKNIKLTWSEIPVQAIGFNENLDSDSVKRGTIASLKGLGIESPEKMTHEIMKEIYLEEDRLFEQGNGKLLTFKNELITSFEGLMVRILALPVVKRSKKLTELVSAIKDQENITSLEMLLEALDRERSKEAISMYSDQDKDNLDGLYELVSDLKENTKRFEYKGTLLKDSEGQPIHSFEGLIDWLSKDKKIVELLKNINVGKISSLDSLRQQIIENSGLSAEDIASGGGPKARGKDVLELIELINGLKETQRKSRSIKDLIENEAMKKSGLTQKDIQDRQKMQELSESINALSKQIETNPKVNQEIDQKIDEYNKISTRVIKSKIQLRFNQFDQLMNYAKTCYASADHNLLLRGWEYGLAATGKQRLSNESVLSNNPHIYQSLLGESYSSESTFYGLDEKLTSLTKKSSIKDLELQKKLQGVFFEHFQRLFNERIKAQYQYGGYALYDTTGRNLNEIEILSDPREWQKLIGWLILETGIEVIKEFDKKDSKVIAHIIDQLSEYTNSPDFYEHFVRTLVNLRKENISHGDPIPEKTKLKSLLKRALEGGHSKPILETYYQSSKIETITVESKNAKDLLIQLIKKIRALKLPNDKKLRIPVRGKRVHAFLLMPNHPSFRSAINSRLTPEAWVNEHLIKKNEKIVFADSNWESNGLRRFFAFTQNDEGDIVLNTVNETGEGLGGIDEMGVTQTSMDQDKWVNDETWELYVV